jgi:hypothetical protein
MARYDTERISSRLQELIEEGNAVAALERQSPGDPSSYIHDRDKVRLQAWLSNVLNIIEATFGASSPQYRHLRELMPNGPYHVSHAYEVFPIVGLLSGAQGDLKAGFLRDQEQLIAADVFVSVLEQAVELNRLGYKDPSAVLMRVVLEDALRRLAKKNGINSDQKASALNDELKKASVYPQPQWRLVQAWLDIGNSAAHGKFEQYGTEGVSAAIHGVEQFLITYFS